MKQSFWKKLLSRKFLIALAAFVAVAVGAWNVEMGDAVADAIVRIGSAGLEVAIAMGYITSEAKVDAASAGRQ